MSPTGVSVPVCRGLFVAGERLGLEPPAGVALLEHVRDPHRRQDLLHSALDESDVVAITEAQRVESVRLLARDVAWRRVALRVDLGVVANERLPVFVARTLDRLADLLAVESHLRSLMVAERDRSPALLQHP